MTPDDKKLIDRAVSLQVFLQARIQRLGGVGSVSRVAVTDKQVADIVGGLLEYNDRLRSNLVNAMVPLEVIDCSVRWELCEELKDEITNVIRDARAALGISTSPKSKESDDVQKG